MDVDQFTEVVEVEDANAKMTRPGCVTLNVIKLRKSYSGTQAAIAQLPAASVRKLFKAGKLRSGLVNYWVRDAVVRHHRCSKNMLLTKD